MSAIPPSAAGAPGPEPPPPAPAPAEPKTWSVGTLTYTSGGLVALFTLLLCGDFAWSMRDRSVGPMAQWYLKHLEVPNLLFGLLISSFPALIGLFLGPLISVKSDRHRGRFGRRIPFLLVTTPIAAFGMIGLGLTPIIATWAHGVFSPQHPFGSWLHGSLAGNAAGASLLAVLQDQTVMAVICFGVAWTAFEFATIAGQAVFGGLINDVVPKPLLGRFYGLFRAVSLIDGMIFNYWLMGKVPTHYTLILIVVGLFYGTAFMWVCLKVKEGNYPPPPPPDPNRRGPIGGVRTYFKECFTNPFYVSVFVMLTTAALAFSPVNTFSIPYARSMQMSMETYGHCIALTYLISLCLSFFLGWLADLFHPIRVSMATLIGYASVTAWGWFFVNSAESFAVTLVLHGVLSGCYFTSAASLGQRLYPHSRFAQFASAAGIFGSLSTMVLAPALGTLIDLTGNVYRHTFAAGGLLALVALVAAWFVYGKFMKLGGPLSYTPPEQ